MSKIFSWLSQRGPTFEACILQLCPDMSAPRNIGSACAVSTFLSPKLTIVHRIRTKETSRNLLRTVIRTGTVNMDACPESKE